MSILKKIQALLERTEEKGSTKAEAISAINLANKLALKAGIDINSIEKQSTDNIVLRKFQFDRKNLYEVDGKLGSHLSSFMGVCWVHNRSKNEIWISGSESDIEAFFKIRRIIGRAMLNEWEIFKKLYQNEGKKPSRASFMNGFCMEIIAQINKKQKGRKQINKQKPGTALVVRKYEDAKEKIVQNLQSKLISKSSRSKVTDSVSFGVGRVSGARTKIQDSIS